MRKKIVVRWPVHEHLEHWVTKTTYRDRLNWLEESNLFVAALQKRCDYPNLSRKSKNVL